MNSTASTSRAKPQNRRKPTNDDAPYTTSSVGVKRAAADRLDGPEPRAKRAKRAIAMESTPQRDVLGDERPFVDFRELPISAVHDYLGHYDLIPQVYPSPLTAHDPLPPTALIALGARHHSLSSRLSPNPPSSATPANRPKRDPKQSKARRSSRLLEDDELETIARTNIQAERHELHVVLAGICQKHFRDSFPPPPSEVGVLAGFMCAVEKWKAARLQ